MVITEEFKKAIIEEINNDAEFGYLLFRAIMNSAGDQIVTTTYLDKALARQSKEFDQKLAQQSKEFNEKLAQQSKEFDQKLAQQSKEFNEKLTQISEDFARQLAQQSAEFDQKLDSRLAQQSAEFDQKLDRRFAQHSAEFDQKLAQQSAEFDQKLNRRLAQQTKELKDFINAKFGRVGARWGESVEASYREFAQTIVAQWGGQVTKWRRKVKTTDEQGRKFVYRYELDLVVTNGHTMLIEMKMHFDVDDVDDFLDNVAQYINFESPTGTIEKVILTFDMDQAAEEAAKKAGITIIMPEV